MISRPLALGLRDLVACLCLSGPTSAAEAQQPVTTRRIEVVLMGLSTQGKEAEPLGYWLSAEAVIEIRRKLTSTG